MTMFNKLRRSKKKSSRDHHLDDVDDEPMQGKGVSSNNTHNSSSSAASHGSAPGSAPGSGNTPKSQGKNGSSNGGVPPQPPSSSSSSRRSAVPGVRSSSRRYVQTDVSPQPPQNSQPASQPPSSRSGRASGGRGGIGNGSGSGNTDRAETAPIPEAGAAAPTRQTPLIMATAATRTRAKCPGYRTRAPRPT